MLELGVCKTIAARNKTSVDQIKQGATINETKTGGNDLRYTNNIQVDIHKRSITALTTSNSEKSSTMPDEDGSG